MTYVIRYFSLADNEEKVPCTEMMSSCHRKLLMALGLALVLYIAYFRDYSDFTQPSKA